VTRVAITTDDFERVAPHFLARRLDPLHLPCVRVETAADPVLAGAREAAAGADLILFTSRRAVELLWPAGGMPEVAVAAVGRVTSSAVAAAGGRVVVAGTSGLSGLVDAAGTRLQGKRVVLIHAGGADPAGMSRLREAVPEIEEHLVYRMVPSPPHPAPVDAVVFASPSAVRGWSLSRSLDGLVVGVIGETTGAAVHRYRAPDVVAAIPSFPALAGALSSFLEVRV
jgi:uroporphyrinogen-III synthase